MTCCTPTATTSHPSLWNDSSNGWDSHLSIVPSAVDRGLCTGWWRRWCPTGAGPGDGCLSFPCALRPPSPTETSRGQRSWRWTARDSTQPPRNPWTCRPRQSSFPVVKDRRTEARDLLRTSQNQTWHRQMAPLPWWREWLAAEGRTGWSESRGTSPSPRAACRGAAPRGPWAYGCEQQRLRWRRSALMGWRVPADAELTAWIPPFLTLQAKNKSNHKDNPRKKKKNCKERKTSSFGNIFFMTTTRVANKQSTEIKSSSHRTVWVVHRPSEDKWGARCSRWWARSWARSSSPPNQPWVQEERGKCTLSQCEVITLSILYRRSGWGIFQFIVCFMSHNAKNPLPRRCLGEGRVVTARILDVHSVHWALHNSECSVPKEGCSTVWLWSV